MSVTVSPASFAFTTLGQPQALTVSEGTFSGTFSATASLPTVIGISNPASVSGPGPITFSLTPLQPIGTNVATVYVSDGTLTTAIPFSITIPYSPGYTGSAAMNMIYLRTNENINSIGTASVLTLMNAGLAEVSDNLGPQMFNQSIPLGNGQNVVSLPNDLQDVISASFSTGLPSAQGTQVYPLDQMEQRMFMDFSGGVPGTGFGPPLVYSVMYDENGLQILQLYPPAFSGFLNVYYRQRPTPWADVAGSTTNMDPQGQEAVILWCCARIEESREKTVVADFFQKQFEAKVEQARDIIRRRTTPKSGMVRDVLTVGRPGYPPWMPSY